MKNIWKIALCFFVSLMSLTSCNLIDDLFDDNDNNRDDRLVGVWDCYGDTMTFNSDGSGSWSWEWYGSNYNREFTWQTSNNELNINYDNSPDEETYSYKIEDNNTNLYLDFKGGTAGAYHHPLDFGLKRKK